jgi:hypothetical protein
MTPDPDDRMYQRRHPESGLVPDPGFPQIDPEAFVAGAYRDYRRANRPYRRAFRGIVHGELGRKILLAVGVSNAKAVDR